MCVCVGVHMPWYAWGHQGTISLPTMLKHGFSCFCCYMAYSMLLPGCLLSFWCVLPSSFPSMNARVTDVHLSSTRKPASSVTFQSRVHSDPFLSGTASASMSLLLLTIYLTVYPPRMLYPLMHPAASSPASHFPKVWPLNIKTQSLMNFWEIHLRLQLKQVETPF